jgi:adenylosuccinate lyase
MLALTNKGMMREEAYLIVQENAMKVWAEGGNLLDYLKNDEQVKKSLTEEELEGIFDLKYHTKNVDYIFKKVFGS